jgi:lipid-A-disaccharide synthase
VTVECAYFGAPTVALYRTSWITYLVARQIVQVKYLAMPNILADAPIFPEFIQHQVTPENLASAVLDLLSQPARRLEIQQRLQQIVQSLGGPGAARRAARLVADLMGDQRE